MTPTGHARGNERGPAEIGSVLSAGVGTDHVPHAQPHNLADPIEVLEFRSWARAYLWSHCDILDLLDAVDPLAAFAQRVGIDTDVAQQIISSAFRPYREGADGY